MISTKTELVIIALIIAVEALDKEYKFKGLMSDLVQKPIFYAGEMRNSDRDLGEPCQFSFDCTTGCCLESNDGKRRCSKKSTKEERCSVSQKKLDLYMDYCPCEKGNKYCIGSPEARCAA